MCLTWIKCSKLLPEDGQNVMYYFAKFNSVHIGRFFYQGESRLPIWIHANKVGFLGGGEVTHWAEIPKGPVNNDN